MSHTEQVGDDKYQKYQQSNADNGARVCASRQAVDLASYLGGFFIGKRGNASV